MKYSTWPLDGNPGGGSGNGREDHQTSARGRTVKSSESSVVCVLFYVNFYSN
jgi:hypothetical protein